MKATNMILARVVLLGMGLTCLVFHANAATLTTFQLQLRTDMTNTSGMAGPQGWTSSSYTWHIGTTNQILRIQCGGLATNQVYHLMASRGTNGALIHLSDFTPNPSGAVMIQCAAGSMHHFTGTNDPGQTWSAMGGWTNHMSWVIFPESGTNWCDGMQNQADLPHLMSVMDGMNGSNGMGGGGMGGPGQGGGVMGGMGGMGNGWPAMTNWWSGMSNWSSTMGSWCWDYTNMWDSGMGFGGASSNWWGSMSSSASHMMPLPVSVSPVPSINGLVVMDQNLQPVLFGDMANPDTFNYHASCSFTNYGIVPAAHAALQVSATGRSTHFAVSVTGLTPGTTYFMAINASNITPVVTDTRGRLRIHNLPSGVISVRGIGSVSILDRNNDVLLTATLPPN